MEKKRICCISAKVDWFEATKLCRQIKEKLNVDVQVLSSDGKVQDYEYVIYVHTSKSCSDQLVIRWLEEASNLNKTFIPIIIGKGWFACSVARFSYKGPNLRTRFLTLYKEHDSFDFYNCIASISGISLAGDVIGAKAKIVTDKDCKLYRGNKCLGSLQAGVPCVVSLFLGKHELVFKAIENEMIQHEEMIKVSSIKQTISVFASFKSPNIASASTKTTSKSKNETSHSGLLKFLLLGLIIIVAIFLLFNRQKTNKTNDDDILQVSKSSCDTISHSEPIETVVDEEASVIEFIKDMYNNRRYISDSFLELHCTNNMLSQLERDFADEYSEQEGHNYALWDFRTTAQDSKTDSDERNYVINVYSSGDGWYTYEFYDDGWLGKNKIKAFVQDGVVLMDAIDRIYDEYDENVKEQVRIIDEQKQAEETVTATVEDNAKLYKVKENVFVRTGPGTSYEPIYSPYSDFISNHTNGVVVFGGSIVKVLSDEQNGFIKVRQMTPENDRDEWREGWVGYKFLEPYN